MTLKKFLKKHRGHKQIINLYFDGCFVSRVCETDEVFHANTIDYSEFRVGKFWSLTMDNGKTAICIDLKSPKKKPIRSTNNKDYKKWMKKYVKEHLDEIGLKDGEDAMD